MLKKYSKIFAVISTVILLTMALAGCGGGRTLQKPAMQEGAVAVEVTGSCDIKLENGVITVSGETNLMNGAIVYISVEAQNGITLDSRKSIVGGESISEDFVVSGDKYDDSVKTITGHITCAPRLYGNQNPDILNVYGSKFENIQSEGNLIWDSTGCFVVFGSKTIDFTK